jgi:hypothetical protein
MLAPSQRGTAMPSETTEHNNSLLSFELPLMYIESGRSLVQFVHVVPRPVCPRPAAPRRRRSRTGSQVSLRLLAARTRRVPGAAHDWYLRDIAGARRVDCEAERHPRSRFPSRHGPATALAAAERNTLQVAGTPMVVIAREVLGGPSDSSPGPTDPGPSTRRTCKWASSPLQRCHRCSIVWACR